MTERKIWVPPVWDDPSMWAYEPLQPFAVGTTVYGPVLVGIYTLEHAVRTWAANFIPLVGTNHTAYVVDANDAVVLGAMYDPDGHIAWAGVEAAYRTLAQFHNPLEVACWELYASGVLAQVESEFPT